MKISKASISTTNKKIANSYFLKLTHLEKGNNLNNLFVGFECFPKRNCFGKEKYIFNIYSKYISNVYIYFLFNASLLLI